MLTNTCCLVYITPNAIQWYDGMSRKVRIHVSSLDVGKVEKNASGDHSSTPFELAIMDDKRCTFVSQTEKGCLHDNEYLIFRNTHFVGEQMGVKITFIQEEKPNLITYVLFENRSPGMVKSYILDDQRSLIGMIKVRHLIIRPFQYAGVDSGSEPCPQFQMLIRKGIHVGHRGAGVDRRVDLSDKFLENTISSLNYAVKSGADMVEFDVHLSKDNVPILYHDFSVYVTLHKKDPQDHDTLELPVKDLTYRQLKLLKLGPERDSQKRLEFVDSDADDNQPFCSLEKALKNVSPCAFNVEIKYDTENPAYDDINHFVDTILKIIFEYHNNRDIVISSFDPDVCVMAQMKQSKYPVLFLIDDIKKPMDVAGVETIPSIEMACYYASAMNLSGVNCYAQNLITDKSLIRFVLSQGLILFCYGAHINDRSIIEDLVKEGVHGLIYDKIDIISPKKHLESMIGN
ncbi:glycerophosphocholine phosphodiesterase GPCPD1-like [Brevipalpus obovatus]|uniref:glycerophosphocholine phosphodiesterase GPCPD1-like n=1 Tax=Brevipalpus obovatus TaxID=246614 RepID=UPI003D9FA914